MIMTRRRLAIRAICGDPPAMLPARQRAGRDTARGKPRCTRRDMMKVLRRSRWLARLAGCTALTAGVAGMVAAASAPSQDAQARVTGIVFQSRVVASWGSNAVGQLGDGTTSSRSLYGDIRFANDVVQVAAGWSHGLAVRSGGTVWAWGYNGKGELGDGSTETRRSPVQVTGL